MQRSLLLEMVEAAVEGAIRNRPDLEEQLRDPNVGRVLQSIALSGPSSIAAATVGSQGIVLPMLTDAVSAGLSSTSSPARSYLNASARKSAKQLVLFALTSVAIGIVNGATGSLGAEVVNEVQEHLKEVFPDQSSAAQEARNALNAEAFFFGKDSAHIDEDAHDAQLLIIRIGTYLQQHPAYLLELVGHTDSTGSESKNQLLSGKRTESVEYWLYSKYPGLKGRVRIRGEGERYASAEVSSADRRVDIVISLGSS